MDYRKSLFQIEQWSPFLAKKIWGLAPLLSAPFTLFFGFKVEHISDTAIEVRVPNYRQNRGEAGSLHTSVLTSAAEYTSKTLWLRHAHPQFDLLTLVSIQGEFSRNVFGSAKVTAKLSEHDRELIIRNLHSGQEVVHEMVVVILDEKNQMSAQVTCLWRFKPLRPLSISGGVDV